jgi:hypothetical protein
MELLDRYLQAVRRYLPVRRQDDIIAELRANMESQIEDKEAELNRPLTQGEFDDLLRKMGSPVLVASRYQPQQYLIGPTIFPLYLYVLRMAIVWAIIIYSLVMTCVLPFTAPNTTGVVDALVRVPGVLINVAAWVTLIFVAIEFFTARYPEKCAPLAGITGKWDPSSLPPLETGDLSGRKPRSFAQAVAEIIFGFLFLAWLLLIPRHPFLIMGPGAVYLQVAPFQLAHIWWTFFWWVVAISVLQIAWRLIDLTRGAWQYPNRTQRITIQAVGILPLILLLSLSDHAYVTLKNPAIDLAHYRDSLTAINWSIRLSLSVVCAIAVLSLVLESGSYAWKTYRKREAAR